MFVLYFKAIYVINIFSFLKRNIDWNFHIGKYMHRRKKIPYEKLVEYLLKITRVLMKSGTNLYSIQFYNIL